MQRFEAQATPLAGLVLLRRQLLTDARGQFSRLYCPQALATHGWQGGIAQVNHSVTRQRGGVRGLHYQRPPHAEIKLVTCLSGTVWDVAVDIRAGSPTFLRGFGVELSADNGCSLLIPQGFAHGFQVLSEVAELLYCHSAPYVAAAEAGLSPLDPRLDLHWPLPPQGLSARDSGFAWLDADFEGIAL